MCVAAWKPFPAAATVLLLATASTLVACAPPTTLVFPGADTLEGSPVLECAGPGAIDLSHFDDKEIHELLPELPAGRSSRQRRYNFKFVDTVSCQDRYVVPVGKHLLLAWYTAVAPGIARFSSSSIPLSFEATYGHRYVVCPGVQYGTNPLGAPIPVAWNPRIVEIEWHGSPLRSGSFSKPEGDPTSPGDPCARTDLRSFR